MSKHTPGPWKTGGVVTRVEVWPEGWNVPMCIADCHTQHAPDNESERVANAKLIAAAPDLLDALKRADDAGIHESTCAYRISFTHLATIRGRRQEELARAEAERNAEPCDCYLSAVRAAIARAEGR